MQSQMSYRYNYSFLLQYGQFPFFSKLYPVPPSFPDCTGCLSYRVFYFHSPIDLIVFYNLYNNNFTELMLDFKNRISYYYNYLWAEASLKIL